MLGLCEEGVLELLGEVLVEPSKPDEPAKPGGEDPAEPDEELTPNDPANSGGDLPGPVDDPPPP